ncbi:unnamed protein product [Pleuronectes platessa]|uniref:Uncharacterized protein n=1 Tax=Pleuronectes platessa TaxID=8262 RepID=A0A9N7ZCS7_PLEPL|nr:unnamed protein product [Pleuronectes platessa]
MRMKEVRVSRARDSNRPAFSRVLSPRLLELEAVKQGRGRGREPPQKLAACQSLRAAAGSSSFFTTRNILRSLFNIMRRIHRVPRSLQAEAALPQISITTDHD